MGQARDGFAVAGAAADTAQQQWGFYMAVFTAVSLSHTSSSAIPPNPATGAFQLFFFFKSAIEYHHLDIML